VRLWSVADFTCLKTFQGHAAGMLFILANTMMSTNYIISVCAVVWHGTTAATHIVITACIIEVRIICIARYYICSSI
jgi:hypothetical protein